MKRDALRSLLRTLLAASIPLAAGCTETAVVGGDASTSPPDLWQCDAQRSVTILRTYNGDLGVTPDGSYLTFPDCNRLCPPDQDAAPGLSSPWFCRIDPLDAGSEGVICNYAPLCIGRRPEGLAATRSDHEANSVAAYFARAAHLEAASVHAFVRLAEELRVHGAPPSLSRLARRAARDEVRHARAQGALAAQFGAVPPPVVVAPAQTRSLVAVAIENAREGCVGETFGALAALWQSEHAEEAAVRSAMRTIAADETRHAELAWAVAAWAAPRLSEEERHLVRAARTAAIESLRQEMSSEPPPELVRVAGVFSRAQALALIDGATRTMWS